MINFGKLIVAIIVLGLPGLVQAEIYKYLDEQGKVQFTDNLANVPADQRNQVEEYEEVVHRPSRQETSKTDEDRENVNEGTSQEHDKLGDEEKASGEEVESEDEAEQLRRSGDQLQTEYEGLIKEKAELEEAASKRLTPKARKGLVQRIQDFNDRMKDFETRREAHNKAVEAHNARVAQDGQESQSGR